MENFVYYQVDYILNNDQKDSEVVQCNTPEEAITFVKTSVMTGVSIITNVEKIDPPCTELLVTTSLINKDTLFIVANEFSKQFSINYYIESIPSTSKVLLTIVDTSGGYREWWDEGHVAELKTILRSKNINEYDIDYTMVEDCSIRIYR